MYYRMTTFSYDPARESEVIALADSVRDEMKAVSYTHLTLPTILLV